MTRTDIVGVVLAGGRSARFGADKPFHRLGDRTMLARAIERLAPQVDRLVLSANGDPSRFASSGVPVVADPIGDHAGPLAGILAGMRWIIANAPGARFVASVASDTPFFPADLVARLAEGRGSGAHEIALAASPSGTHQVFGLWALSLANDMEKFLNAGEGKVLTFASRHRRVDVSFDAIALSDGTKIDPFFNVNTLADAAKAEGFAAQLDALSR